MEGLGEFVVLDAMVHHDGRSLEVSVPVDARTQTDALAKGARLNPRRALMRL
jgi:hypothetical protein